MREGTEGREGREGRSWKGVTSTGLSDSLLPACNGGSPRSVGLHARVETVDTEVRIGTLACCTFGSSVRIAPDSVTSITI